MFNFKTLEIMNLENLNLVELNAQEVQEVEGGCWDCKGLPQLWEATKTTGKAVLGFLAGVGDGIRAGME